MPLIDRQIIEYAEKGMIRPFHHELVNPASYDVRLGSKIYRERGSFSSIALNEYDYLNALEEIDISDYTVDSPFWFEPSGFVLGETLEEFWLPPELSVEFKLCSTPARTGYDHASAAWGDPGWHNSKLTLELCNNFKRHWLPLFPGLIIGQMIFWPGDKPDFDYSQKGRYNGDSSVQKSKGLKYFPEPKAA